MAAYAHKEGIMNRVFALRRLAHVLLVMAAFVWLGAASPGELDPKAIAFQTPGQIKWVESGNGASASAIITGDPTKEGLYVQLMKWHPHHNSTPHFHPHDRFITVLSGTWWVATGSNYDMNNAVPMKAGTVVTHFGNQIHYDGAKGEECVMEIVGMGPATSTPAPKQ
jgi:quercetin dioxygenase-like cupin family protein